MIHYMQSILTHHILFASAPVISTTVTSTSKSTSKKTGSAREQRMDPVELELLRKKEREQKANQRKRRSTEVQEAQNAKQAERQKEYRLKKKKEIEKCQEKYRPENKPEYKPKQRRPRGYNMKHKSEEAKAEYNKKTAERMRLWRAKNYGPSDNECKNSNQPEEIKEFWSKCSEEELEKMHEKKNQYNDRAARRRKNDRRHKKANGIKREWRKYQRRKYR